MKGHVYLKFGSCNGSSTKYCHWVLNFGVAFFENYEQQFDNIMYCVLYIHIFQSMLEALFDSFAYLGNWIIGIWKPIFHVAHLSSSRHTKSLQHYNIWLLHIMLITPFKSPFQYHPYDKGGVTTLGQWIQWGDQCFNIHVLFYPCTM